MMTLLPTVERADDKLDNVLEYKVRSHKNLEANSDLAPTRMMQN